jgi:formate/nitrite transporter FocA (FNT family)
VLSILAGAFIAFGAVFATTVSAGTIAVTPASDGAVVYPELCVF